jgi:hypothetical protein
MIEESIFEFVLAVTLPECSRRTLDALAAEKKFFRRAFVVVRGYSERVFEVSYARTFHQWMAEDTAETSRRLAEHLRCATPGKLYVSDN